MLRCLGEDHEPVLEQALPRRLYRRRGSAPCTWRLKARHRDGRCGLRSHPRTLQRHIHDQGVHASLPQSRQRERDGRTRGHTSRIFPHDADTGRPGDVLACRGRHETLGVRSFRMLAFVLESRIEPVSNGHQCVPIPWRTVHLPKKLKLGILWDDGLHTALLLLPTKPHQSSYSGVVAPSPACRRALQTVVSLLEQDGHEITTMSVSGHVLSCTYFIILYAVTAPAHSGPCRSVRN